MFQDNEPQTDPNPFLQSITTVTRPSQDHTDHDQVCVCVREISCDILLTQTTKIVVNVSVLWEGVLKNVEIVP